MNDLLIRSLTLVALPGILQAQHFDQGPIIGTHAAVLTAPTTPLPNGTNAQLGVIYSKKGGFEPARRTTSSDPDRPQFSALAILGPAASTVEIDALSIGLDRIPLEPCSTTLDYSECQCWTSLLFSVERETVTASSAAVFSREIGQAGGVGADLFGYVSISNVLGTRPPYIERLPEDFRTGELTRVLDATDLGFYDPMRPADEGQIVAVDAFMPMFQLDAEIVARYYSLRGNPRVYFSVTAATAMNLPSRFWGSAMGPSGATIYQAEWDRGLARWIARDPLFLASDLDLEDADVDALAYDQESGNAVLSLDLQTTPSRLAHLSQWIAVTRCTNLGGGGLLVGDYMETVNGVDQPVAMGAGVGNGVDVTGTCEEDPSGRQLSRALHSLIVGTPQPRVLAIARYQVLEASIYRDCDAAGAPVLSLQISGGRCDMGGLSDMFALVSIPGVLPHIAHYLGTVPRTCRGVDFDIPLPGSLGVPSMLGFPLVVAAAEIRGSGLLFSREFVIQI